ncbi:unnamed protein product [Cylicocyclus nassatus]|uniref:Uncharacterized protein n=1 Tax=Cylicocyclus nassatus TaxID=53992 RepID=A0AA36H0Z8_CYLNA|nr:unnamed protein product [Cylicocyclus nassatus]
MVFAVSTLSLLPVEPENVLRSSALVDILAVLEGYTTSFCEKVSPSADVIASVPSFVITVVVADAVEDAGREDAVPDVSSVPVAVGSKVTDGVVAIAGIKEIAEREGAELNVSSVPVALDPSVTVFGAVVVSVVIKGDDKEVIVAVVAVGVAFVANVVEVAIVEVAVVIAVTIGGVEIALVASAVA